MRANLRAAALLGRSDRVQAQSRQSCCAASARRLRWWTRKQLVQVNSSGCLGMTRTVSSGSSDPSDERVRCRDMRSGAECAVDSTASVGGWS